MSQADCGKSFSSHSSYPSLDTYLLYIFACNLLTGREKHRVFSSLNSSFWLFPGLKRSNGCILCISYYKNRCYRNYFVKLRKLYPAKIRGMWTHKYWRIFFWHLFLVEGERFTKKDMPCLSVPYRIVFSTLQNAVTLHVCLWIKPEFRKTCMMAQKTLGCAINRIEASISVFFLQKIKNLLSNREN